MSLLVTDLAAAVVLGLTAATMTAAGRLIGGPIRAALAALAVNVAAVAVIFAAFAYSTPFGLDVRPWAKAVDGAAALVAAVAVHRLAGE